MKISVLIAASVAIVLMSCEKNSTENNTTGNSSTSIPKIKTRATSTETTTYTYDGNGKVLTEVSTNGRKIEYTYTIPGQIKKSFSFNGAPSSNYIYSLNVDGLVTLIVSPDVGNNDISQYTYNPNKSLSTETNTMGSNTQRADYFYINDNIDSIRYTNPNGSWMGTAYLTYYSDQPRKFSLESFGQYFNGKENAHMIKRRQVKYPSSLIEQQDYLYEYDTVGRLVRIISTTNSGAVFTETYTYY